MGTRRGRLYVLKVLRLTCPVFEYVGVWAKTNGGVLAGEYPYREGVAMHLDDGAGG